jgi:hypothetical protein
MRFYGHSEYASKPAYLNHTHSNTIVLREFTPASYIICITIFSTVMPDELYPPLSTTGMCIDLLVGDSAPQIGKHHGGSGLLAPVLFGFAALLLFLIMIGYYMEKWKLIAHLTQLIQGPVALEAGFGLGHTGDAIQIQLGKNRNNTGQVNKQILFENAGFDEDTCSIDLDSYIKRNSIQSYIRKQ